jgi:uncharacterized protein YprB with RNaseH-like and TPR domain
MAKFQWTDKAIAELKKLKDKGYSWDEMTALFRSAKLGANTLRKAYYRYFPQINASSAKVLVLDIETAPLEVFCWGLFDQNIGLEMIKQDWSVLSWSAKWVGSDKVMYMDTSAKKDVRDDRDIVAAIWKLLDEADITLTQNGVRFDIKKLNTKFLDYGFPPPSSFRNIDTLQISKKYFAQTSNKLEYLTKKYCKKFKKSGHKKFPGFSLWKECMAGNAEAWKEMAEYNKIDVLSLEELYLDYLRVWDKTINFSVFTEGNVFQCSCGSMEFKPSGFKFTNAGKFQRVKCRSCGKEYVEKENLLSKEKREGLKK